MYFAILYIVYVAPLNYSSTKAIALQQSQNYCLVSRLASTALSG